jgi:DNA invertase Pin-like site-specific DNA recombinase
VFREEGVSGTKELDNRPALLELMTALHSNGVKLVMVEKLDRLARDLMVQETIIGDLRKNGFGLVSVCEPDLLQDDPSRKLMRQIFGAIAEYEKTMIVLKLRGARVRQKARTGRCEGAKPYGTLPG